MNSWTRRDFTKTVIMAGATTALGAVRAAGANDRVRLGFIGVGNRGDQVLDAFLTQPDAEVVALCDLSQDYMDFAAKKIGASPRQFHDYRQLLELKDLDAVVIAVPDHWHALQTIQACQAGKDVYVEKPLSLCVAEGRAMVKAVRGSGRVCQVGIHRRSVPVCQEAAQFVRAGGLGKVTAARAFHVQNEWPSGIGNPPDENPPANLDWEAWLGPAPKRSYNKNRTFYRFRWFYDYSGGQVTNFGVHYLDFIQWALGADAPVTVTALGARAADLKDNREIPDTLEAIWQYPGGTLVTFSQFNATAGRGACLAANSNCAAPWERFTFSATAMRSCPTRFRKTNSRRARPSRGSRTGATGETPSAHRTPQGPCILHGRHRAHARNFLDCVKSRAKCNCDIEIGHRSTSATLLANIALKTRAVLDWDAQTEQFVNHPQANELLRYQYRAAVPLSR